MLLADIPYASGHGVEPSAQRTLDLYVNSVEIAKTRPLVVFVHGGAWVADDKAAHKQLAERLATATGCAVAVPNYSLCPRPGAQGVEQVQHPAHARDVLLALEFLRTWDGTPAEGQGQLDSATPSSYYDPKTIFAIGHSCAAHILSAIFLAPSQKPEPQLVPSEELQRAVRGIVTTEGIFDIDLLLQSFPAYRDWFIARAFGDRDSYHDVSTNYFDARSTDIAWLLIQSKGDTLVDRLQSSAMYDRLVQLYGDEKRSLVEKDWETFETEHDDTLHTDVVVQLIASFVEKHTNSE